MDTLLIIMLLFLSVILIFHAVFIIYQNKNKKLKVIILFFLFYPTKNIVAVFRRGVNLPGIISGPGTAFNINNFSNRCSGDTLQLHTMIIYHYVWRRYNKI